MHFSAKMYSSKYSLSLEHVNLNWVFCHYAQWDISPNHSVVLSLTRVSCFFHPSMRCAGLLIIGMIIFHLTKLDLNSWISIWTSAHCVSGWLKSEYFIHLFHFLWCSIFSPFPFTLLRYALSLLHLLQWLRHTTSHMSPTLNTIDTSADIIPVHSLSPHTCMSTTIISCILLQRLPLRAICVKNFTMKHLPTSTKHVPVIVCPSALFIPQNLQNLVLTVLHKLLKLCL